MAAPVRPITAEAAAVLINVTGKPFSIAGPSRLRSMKTRIVTCKYEQIAVESANPAVPINQISVKLRTIFTNTAISALRMGVLESCIE